MISSTDGVGRWARRLVAAAVSGAARAATGSTMVVTPDPVAGSAAGSVVDAAGIGSTPAAKRSAKKSPAAKKSAAKTTAPSKATVAAKTTAPGTKKPAATAKKAPSVAKPSSATKSPSATKAPPPARPSRAKPATTKAPTTTARGTTASVAKAVPAKAVPTTAAPATFAPRSLQVREDETPWTAAELREVRTELEHDVARLTSEIEMAETGLHELLRDSGDGTGDDQADAGAKTFEREQEIALANNSREMLVQSNRALTAIDDGTYGVCESCALPVGKMRLQAFPRATLCVSCKQRQERR